MSETALLLDVGNSYVKWTIANKAGFDAVRRCTLDELAGSLTESLAGLALPDSVLCASVASPEKQRALAQSLPAAMPAPWFARTAGECLGLRNSYEDPTRMGVDRWLAMLAAWKRCASAFCVVDAGSALTIDLVADDGLHQGGYIIPGMQLMRRSLTLDTDRVRFDPLPSVDCSPGTSTATAVEHGVLLAQCGAVHQALGRLGDASPSELFLCGGGAELLGAHLELPYQWMPNLVFEGLLLQAAAEGVIAGERGVAR